MCPQSGTPKSRSWGYDLDGSSHLVVPDGILCGNGVTWCPDNKTRELRSLSEKPVSFEALLGCKCQLCSRRDLGVHGMAFHVVEGGGKTV